MQSDLAAITTALTAARARLDAHLRNETLSVAGHAALATARDQIDSTLITLTDAERAASEVVAVIPEPRLLDQIVLLQPTVATDAFRTKVALKAVEQQGFIDPRASEAEGRDDLTRIRGIEQDRALALIGLGFETFQSIARWGQTDVQRVSAALKLGREISRQNWIEQAALLERAKPLVLPAVEQRLIEPSQAEPAEVAATLAIAPKPLAPDVHAEQLSLIKGLSASHQALLRSGGVQRWADIAAWRREDIADWQAALGADAPITKAGWIEQAALLATGSTTRFANGQIRGVGASVVAQPNVVVLPPPVFAPWAVEPRAPKIELPFEPAPQPVPVVVAEQPPGDMPAPIDLTKDTATVPLALMVAPQEVPDIDLPTALDRVAALESELASLVANDTAARPSKAPEMTFEPVQRTLPAPFNIEDEEFQELNVSEADVVIVPRNKTVPVAAPKPADTISTRTLLARMRRVPPIEDIEADRYAAYRDRAEEASVEIIRASEPRAERVSAAQALLPKPVERPIKRLLLSLKRQD